MSQHIKNATSLNTTDLPNNHTTLKLYLNVNEEFVFSGVIPENYIIYVPNDMVEKFLYEWIVSKEQLIAYDFLNNEE